MILKHRHCVVCARSRKICLLSVIQTMGHAADAARLARQTQEEIPLFRRPTGIAEAADTDGRADSDQRQPADVVGRQQQLRRPVRLEPRLMPPEAAGRYPVFVGVEEITFRESLERLSHLVDRRWRQRVMLTQERRPLAAGGAKRGVPSVRPRGAGRHAQDSYPVVASNPGHGSRKLLDRVHGRDQDPLPPWVGLRLDR